MTTLAGTTVTLEEAVTKRRRRHLTWLYAGLALGFLALFLSIFANAYLSVGRQQKINIAEITMTDLRVALLNYRQEYGKWPPGTEVYGKDAVARTDGAFMKAMAGGEVIFFTWQPDRNARVTGFRTHPETGELELVDPWSTPYVVYVDANLDGRIQAPAQNGVAGESQIVYKSAVMISYGPNKQPGKGRGQENDDIYFY